MHDYCLYKINEQVTSKKLEEFKEYVEGKQIQRSDWILRAHRQKAF
jgi:hypothetical protein